MSPHVFLLAAAVAANLVGELPMIGQRTFRRVLILALATMLSACGDRPIEYDGDSPEVRQSDASPLGSHNELVADKDWEQVVVGAQRDDPPPGSDEFVHYMEGIQEDLLWVRDKGLEFWAKYPNDPRRYIWLAGTINNPPAYAKNLDEWARNERLLGPNKAAIDALAKEDWDQKYATLRKEFFEANQVSDALRRYLWAGEIQQGLKRIREAKARGAPIPSYESVLERLLEFVEAYPTSFDESEYQTYLWSLSRSLDYIALSELYELQASDLHDLAEELAETGSEAGSSLAERYTDPRLGRLAWWWKAADASLVTYFGNRESWSWKRLNSELPRGYVLAAIRMSNLRFPSFGQPKHSFHLITHQFDRKLATLKNRIHGLQYWDFMTNEEKLEWVPSGC